jgi:hypothetical protein
MAKKQKGNRIQIILECTEQKGTGSLCDPKKPEKHTGPPRVEKIQPIPEKNDRPSGD